MKNLSILYVEDEDGIRESLVEFIKNFSDNVFVAKNGQEGLDLFLKEKIDIVISDIKMPIMSGIEMVHAIKELNPEAYIIFTTAHSDNGYMSEAIDMQVDGYILKPVDFDKLESKLTNIIELIGLHHKLSVHDISNPNMNAKDNIFVALGGNQNIIHANDEFLSFFNIEHIDGFYHKYGFFHSIFIKEDGCFYPRENENWINDFRRVKKNKRSFMALFDEVNDNVQIVVGNVYDMNDGLSVGISFKKVDSLDYFKKTNDENNALDCMTKQSKENMKKLLYSQLEKNEYSTIKIINITSSSDDIEALDELSENVSNNIRHTDSLKKCDTNNLFFVITDISSENTVKLVDRLEHKIFRNDIKGEIKVINVDSEEAIEKAFSLNIR